MPPSTPPLLLLPLLLFAGSLAPGAAQMSEYAAGNPLQNKTQNSRVFGEKLDFLLTTGMFTLATSPPLTQLVDPSTVTTPSGYNDGGCFFF